MDLIIYIFTKLGVDESIVPQFFIVLVLFFLLKAILFSRLQEILELRESKTTKLDDGANKKFTEAEELFREYKERIEAAQEEAQSGLSLRKKAVDIRESKAYSKIENEIESDVTKRRAEFTQELEMKRTEILKEADGLSEDFVSKLTS